MESEEKKVPVEQEAPAVTPEQVRAQRAEALANKYQVQPNFYTQRIAANKKARTAALDSLSGMRMPTAQAVYQGNMGVPQTTGFVQPPKEDGGNIFQTARGAK